jgi:5-methylthioadenosine/S-adenosylhomocysteine deaminase
MTGQSGFLVIRGGRLLDIAAHRAPFADLLVEGDTIREVGQPRMIVPAGTRHIDASGKLLMPGLVNAHTHGHGSFTKGVADRWTLELLLNASPWTTGNFTAEDKYLAARVNALEMVRKGCTAAYDLYFEFPGPTFEGITAAAQAYADVGVRAVIAPLIADRTLYDAVPGLFDALPDSLRAELEKRQTSPCSAIISRCADILQRWPFDRITVRPALAPTIPLHCSDEMIVACRDLAREYNVGIQMHLAESKIQALAGIKRYGKTLTEHLDALGLIGPHFTGAHCIWLDDEDIRRLADKGASVAHNPGSNLRLGSGIAPVRKMLEHKLAVGIGTDGSTSSDNQNMFEATRMASFVSRVHSSDYRTWISTEEALELATTGGARLLGLDGKIGRIAPGYLADIVFIDLTSVNYVPLNDITNQIVNCEDSSAVESVMIGGRMVLDHGRFVGIDYTRLMREVEAAVERLRATNADAKALASKIEGVVGLYCVGLARQPYHVQRLCGHS